METIHYPKNKIIRKLVKYPNNTRNIPKPKVQKYTTFHNRKISIRYPIRTICFITALFRNVKHLKNLLIKIKVSSTNFHFAFTCLFSRYYHYYPKANVPHTHIPLVSFWKHLFNKVISRSFPYLSIGIRDTRVPFIHFVVHFVFRYRFIYIHLFLFICTVYVPFQSILCLQCIMDN